MLFPFCLKLIWLSAAPTAPLLMVSSYHSMDRIHSTLFLRLIALNFLYISNHHLAASKNIFTLHIRPFPRQPHSNFQNCEIIGVPALNNVLCCFNFFFRIFNNIFYNKFMDCRNKELHAFIVWLTIFFWQIDI